MPQMCVLRLACNLKKKTKREIPFLKTWWLGNIYLMVGKHGINVAHSSKYWMVHCKSPPWMCVIKCSLVYIKWVVMELRWPRDTQQNQRIMQQVGVSGIIVEYSSNVRVYRGSDRRLKERWYMLQMKQRERWYKELKTVCGAFQSFQILPPFTAETRWEALDVFNFYVFKLLFLFAQLIHQVLRRE